MSDDIENIENLKSSYPETIQPFLEIREKMIGEGI
jgi:hypothetical protein